MDKYLDIIENLLRLQDEYEWLDFKENWFNKDEIGEYISAIANGACLCGKEYGYIIWGVKDNSRDIVGTSINFDKDINHEPYKHYLARNLKPSIAFEVIEKEYQGKRIVMLQIPSSKSVQTKYKEVSYFRIGSSKEKINKFPEWELKLNTTLQEGFPTIVNVAAPDYAQDLTFEKLFMYYAAKGISLKLDSFERSLKLINKNGQYNVMAYILSDQNSIPVRVSIFSGQNKAEKLFSVKEFGNQSLISVIDRIIDYSDSINITRAIEHFDKGYREDLPLFNQECFNEALKNAFIHNNWLRRVSPMITFYNDRVEIISFSRLAPRQTIEGFYKGNSIPVNEDLSSIFLATHLSERSGKGMPLLVSTYGRDIFEISEESIKVTIPYNWQHKFEELVDKPVDKLVDKLSKTERLIYESIILNPHLSQQELALKCGVGKTTVQNVIIKLKTNELIKRVGSNKTGYWEVLK